VGSECRCEVQDKDLEHIEQCKVVEGFLELYRAYRGYRGRIAGFRGVSRVSRASRDIYREYW